MGDLVEVILPVFLVIGAGFLAVRRGWFSSSGVSGLMAFTQKFAIPCLLFNAIVSIDLGASFDLALLGSFYLGAATCFALGIVGARTLFGRPWPDSIAIGFACLFSNSVLLGLPISERAYGADSLSANFAIVSVHSPFCYLLGITAMEMVRNTGGNAWQTLRAVVRGIFSNALVMGLAAGFVVNLGGIPLPGVLTDAIDLMVAAALPAAIFGLGGVLAQYRPEGDMATVAMMVALSLILHPAIALGTGSALGLSQEALRAAVITAAMAPGINAYVFADMYGCARRVAATAVLVGTASSLITVWVWLQILG